MPKVSVIIPNWNGRHYLESCLQSLHEQSFRDFVIYVVDNGSIDNSVAWIRESHPDVIVIANETNLGFARAINQGICASESQYVVTLNNDTWVPQDWLSMLVAAADAHPAIGMCACKMVFADHPDIINSAGIAVDKLGIAWDRQGGAPDVSQTQELEEVFGPCAGAALYRRAMLTDIGLFDEVFFAYLEDVDLAWRARRAGWRCLYVPQARVLHHHSATAKEGSPFKSFHLGRNKVWLLLKNYPFRELWYVVPLVWLYDGMSLVYALLFRWDIHSWRGRWAALRGAGAMWRKRQTVASTVARVDISFLSSIEWPWQIARRYWATALLGRQNRKSTS